MYTEDKSHLGIIIQLAYIRIRIHTRISCLITILPCLIQSRLTK